jgi:hypothetical protein
VKSLRRRHAETCNYHLAEEGHAKRYDPRPYSESGIAKTPTQHLGTKSAALEGFGLETTRGQRNARAEIEWRYVAEISPWIQRAEIIEESKIKDENLTLIVEQGLSFSRKAAAHDIASELLLARFERRRRFLEKEIGRLTSIDDASRILEISETVGNLMSEGAALAARAPELHALAARCHTIAATHRLRSNQALRSVDEELKSLGVVGHEDQSDEVMNPLRKAVGQKLLVEPAPSIDDRAKTEKDDDRQAHHASRIDEPASAGLSDVEAGNLAKIIASSFDGKDARLDASVPQASSPESTDDKVANAVASLLGGRGDFRPREMKVEDFPEAMPVPPPRDDVEIRKLDAKLISMDNRSVRIAAIATRDATDMCPSGSLRSDMNRGWVVLRSEAERRGVDIDTGRQDLSRATDKDRARIHQDEQVISTESLRKILTKQRPSR